MLTKNEVLERVRASGHTPVEEGFVFAGFSTLIPVKCGRCGSMTERSIYAIQKSNGQCNECRAAKAIVTARGTYYGRFSVENACGLSYDLVKSRIRMGWTPDEAMGFCIPSTRLPSDVDSNSPALGYVYRYGDMKYFGITLASIGERRWRQHINESLWVDSCGLPKTESKFKTHLRTRSNNGDGKENILSSFSFEFSGTIEEALKWERDSILKNESYEKGLNGTRGGEFPGKFGTGVFGLSSKSELARRFDVEKEALIGWFRKNPDANIADLLEYITEYTTKKYENARLAKLVEVEEEWKSPEGYPDWFEVSTHCRARTLARGTLHRGRLARLPGAFLKIRNGTTAITDQGKIMSLSVRDAAVSLFCADCRKQAHEFVERVHGDIEGDRQA
jgi:hypothetical protein